MNHVRPHVHYTARSTWLNDPNGLIHHEGRWHLFYQSNPFGDRWGNMSWGHAVSRDLLHWEELDVALLATDEIHYFSGSCVYDRHNTSGLGRDGIAPLVAVFTEHYTEASPRFGTQAQGIAYSLDGGLTFTRYQGNPVLCRGSSDFRDPKVSWVEPFGFWLMAAVEATQNIVTLYRSDNLLDWELLSEFGPANATAPTWECPDLFPLQVEDTGETKWVLIVSINPGGLYGGSSVQYFVGDFDGTTFTAPRADTSHPRDFQWLDHGADFYAPVTFNDAPDGRRVAMGWMSNWAYADSTPTKPWRGAMAIPRELSLLEENGRFVVRQRPIPELHALLDETETPVPTESRACAAVAAVFGAGVIDLVVPTDGRTALTVGAAEVRIDDGRVEVHRHPEANLPPEFGSIQWVDIPQLGSTLDLAIVVDAGSIEVFVDHGRRTITSLAYHPANEIEVAVTSGTATVTTTALVHGGNGARSWGQGAVT